jgi:uncharacterized membrane protein SirB2
MADQKESSGLKLFDTVLLVGAGVIAVVVAFAALSFIASVVWELVKVVIVVAIIGALGWFLLRRRR